MADSDTPRDGRRIQVANSRPEDSGRGLAHVPRALMAALGIAEGDVIEILGKQSTPARAVGPYREDEGLDILRIDGLQRANAGVGSGDFVEVRKADSKPATLVVFAPAQQNLRLQGSTTRLKATFFCIGDHVKQHPQLCCEIVARGHDVQNHTQRHSAAFAFSGLNGYRREIMAAQATLTEVTGNTPRFFRAPAGIRSPLLQPVLHELGLQLVSWTRRGFDTRCADPAVVSRRLIAGLRPGAILLLHDGHAARTNDGMPVILAVLPQLLEAAKQRDLRWVTLSEAV